jgi:phenylpropionate dioxygenase-like ring-hydroxylating dioxygenase large terminal subunit
MRYDEPGISACYRTVLENQYKQIIKENDNLSGNEGSSTYFDTYEDAAYFITNIMSNALSDNSAARVLWNAVYKCWMDNDEMIIDEFSRKYRSPAPKFKPPMADPDEEFESEDEGITPEQGPGENIR